MDRIERLALPIALLFVASCHYGYVGDATTGAPVSGVRVSLASGECAGAGCVSSTSASDHTDADGLYVFDGYGDFEGANHVKHLTVAPGEEAMRLRMSKRGYLDLVVHHRSRWIETPYNGQTYYRSELPEVFLCRPFALDQDGDGLCDAAETQYGTSPTSADTDGDGFSDAAEILGLDGVDLRSYGASPLRRDVFVEVDYYPGLRPDPAALDDVVAAFAAAPVSNPDGSTGISLHVELDEAVTPATLLDEAWVGFDRIKARSFAGRRARIFHYAVFADQLYMSGATGRSKGIPGRDFVITLGSSGGTRMQQAGTFMHELGHNLGLRHGGGDGVSFKPHYFSVMNYNYQDVGLRRSGATGVLDYSRTRVAAVDERSVQESSGFSPGPGATFAELATYEVRIKTVSGHAWLSGDANTDLDMDRDGTISYAPRRIDLDGDGRTRSSWGTTQNDWDNLQLPAGGSIGDVPLPSIAASARVSPQDMDPCLGD